MIDSATSTDDERLRQWLDSGDPIALSVRHLYDRGLIEARFYKNDPKPILMLKRAKAAAGD